MNNHKKKVDLVEIILLMMGIVGRKDEFKLYSIIIHDLCSSLFMRLFTDF